MEASFNVGVVGLEPIQYQWRCNGTDIPGANDATLTFTNASAENAGVYDVVITNSIGVAVSIPVTLSVQVFRPAVQRMGVGSDGNFGFDVSGPSGLVVIIAASTNLVDWTPILTAPLVNGQLHFSDPLWKILPKRFYRAQFASASSPQPSIQASSSALTSAPSGFGFNITGMPGQTAVVETSTNLVSWTPLQTNLLLTGYCYASDPQSTSLPERFYRIRLQ
jgi:hypothetical protein